MSDGSLEIEVKFLVNDLAAVRCRLEAAGAVPKTPRTYEHNIRYDNDWEGLRLQGKLLRLRQDSAARLTYKGLPPETIQSEARVRQEFEVEVSDFKTMSAILEQVGFQPFQVYEKYRQTYTLGVVEVVLDEMPFGYFVEFEGPDEALRAACEQCALDWQKRILANYLALMAELQARYDLPFDDLTFDNFAGIEYSAADIVDYAD